MDKLRGCSIYDKRATLVNNIPTSDKNILRSILFIIQYQTKNTPERNKSLFYPLDIENSIYTITPLQGIIATAVADEQSSASDERDKPRNL